MSDTGLVHYIIVRRDIPNLRKMIDIGHAAGESFAEYGYIIGCNFSYGSSFDVSRTTLILRGARNEAKLLKLEKYLREQTVNFTSIREPDAPWNNQLMAIALWPGFKIDLNKYVNDFQDLNLTEPDNKE